MNKKTIAIIVAIFIIVVTTIVLFFAFSNQSSSKFNKILENHGYSLEEYDTSIELEISSLLSDAYIAVKDDTDITLLVCNDSANVYEYYKESYEIMLDAFSYNNFTELNADTCIFTYGDSEDSEDAEYYSTILLKYDNIVMITDFTDDNKSELNEIFSELNIDVEI